MVLARVIVLEATDVHGVTMRWRLDAPTALRWGRDRVFDQALLELQERWRTCAPASSAEVERA